MPLLWNNSKSMHSTIAAFQIIVNFCQLTHYIVTTTFADGHVMEFVCWHAFTQPSQIKFLSDSMPFINRKYNSISTFRGDECIVNMTS